MAKFTRQARRSDTTIAGLYDLEERLGSGHFAEVKLARHVFTGERVAVKVIDKLKLDETAKHHLYQEVRCMKLVQHPNIVRLYEVIDTNTKLYLVQELGDGGDMYDYIMKHDKGLSEEKARRYFRQILQAIDYCHRLYVVHRDLKPENVIFFKKFDVAKLTDFGFSNKFLPGKKLETACGSLAYSAPEILLGDSYDAPAVDVWSLGVILYMMVVGKAPFYEANESETLTMILDCKFHIPDHVSSACQSLISRMIVRDACERATLEDILDDPWVQRDHGPVAVTSVPLANQVKLGVDQHNEIVEKMQLGDIADHETIKRCLESGSYNHVSATYYLLAEQILRRLRWRKTVSSSSSMTSSAPDTEVKSHALKRQSIPPQQTKCSLSKEIVDVNLTVPRVEDRPLSDGNDPGEPELEDIDMNLMTNKLRYHSTESIYDEIKKSSDKQHDQEEIVGTVSVSMTKNQRKTFQKKRVAKVKSTPAFLNQISEERESDLDDSPRASPRVRRSSRRPLDVLKAQQKNRRPSPASSSGGRRSSSHSSSSEDDGDLDKKMRRLSTERCRRSPKRRSDDEGDGDDSNGGTKGPHGVARKKMMSERPQSTSCKKETSSESGSSSNEQGQTTQLGLHSELLQHKLVNVYMKVSEDQSTSNNVNNEASEITVMETVSCDQTGLGNNLSVCSKDVIPSEKLSDQQDRRPNFIIGAEYVGQLKASIEEPANSDNDIECLVDVEGTSENKVAKVDQCESFGETSAPKVENEVGTKSENMLVDAENPSMPSTDCLPDSENGTERIPASSQKEIELPAQNSGEMSNKCAGGCESARKTNVRNNKYIIDDGINVLSEENRNRIFKYDAIKSEFSRSTGENDYVEKDEASNSTLKKDEIIGDGIIELLKERNFSDDLETCENVSDKENVDITEKKSKTYLNCDTSKVALRGSDIEEIEMYMKAKEAGLELDPVAVRTIFNNPKMSRVTSNCCQII